MVWFGIVTVGWIVAFIVAEAGESMLGGGGEVEGLADRGGLVVPFFGDLLSLSEHILVLPLRNILLTDDLDLKSCLALRLVVRLHPLAHRLLVDEQA